MCAAAAAASLAGGKSQENRETSKANKSRAIRENDDFLPPMRALSFSLVLSSIRQSRDTGDMCVRGCLEGAGKKRRDIYKVISSYRERERGRVYIHIMSRSG